MLCRPFEADNLASVVGKIINDTYEPITSDYSEELRAIVDILLVKDPANRVTIEELLTNPIMQRKAEELGLSEEESKLSGSNSSGSDSRTNINPKKRSYQKEISIAIPTPTNQKLLESKMRQKQPSSAPSHSHQRRTCHQT